MTSRVKYHDIECISLTNGETTLLLAAAIGPRILSYGFDGGENVLGWHPEASVETPLGTWKMISG